MISLSEISHLINKSVLDGLAKDDEARFTAIKKEAIGRINSIAGTNLETSGTRPPQLDWAITPFAWIVEYIAITHFQNLSGDYLAQAKYKYQEAIEIAKSNALPAKTGRRASTGEIEGAYKL